MRILTYYPRHRIKRIDKSWMYGHDIIDALKARHPDWEFVIADGSIPKVELYENIDLLLRPNRHDGTPVMVLEAKQLNIPVIWSYDTGKYIEPELNEIESRIKEIFK